MDPIYLDPRTASEYLAARGVTLSPATLATWRCRTPDALPFRRVGGRVYYRRSDLDELLTGARG